jgi:hypothetical protein
MKFPITREELQSFDHIKARADLQEEAIQKRFALILEQLCNEFKASMPSNSTEKRFVWRQFRNITEFQLVRHYNLNSSISEDRLSQFIEKLKAIFIGCDIIIDPLQTYLIIDWS